MIPSRVTGTLVSGDASTREIGTQFLIRLYAALRVLKLYPIENERTQQALDDLTTAAGTLLEHDRELEVRIAGEFLFVNSTRLRLGIDNYASFSHVINTLRGCGVGTVRVESGVDRRQWQVFASLLLDVASQPDSTDKLSILLNRNRQAGIVHIHLQGILEGEEAPDDEQRKALAKRTYERSVGVTKDLVNSARVGRVASLRKVKRAVQGMVDQVLNNETSIIGLTTIRDYDDYTFTHSVNVCIFSLSIGKRLALSKRQLFDLGMAALLHDIGKSRVPLEILNKAGSLDDREWGIIRAHPWLGVLSLFGLQGFADIQYRSMIAAHEHHMKLNLSGYPRTKRLRSLSMFSKLVSVADIFDAATSRRVYATKPIQPDQILQEMMVNHERVGVDLVLVKALINLLGIYPVGTCVILDTYELAIVHAANDDPSQINRPLVRIIISDLGALLDPCPVVDLAEKRPDGNYLKSIIKVVDPQRYNINPSDYFV